jgi:transcription antitermination protein NusB
VKEIKERSRARAWALQALYAWEMRGEDADQLLLTLHQLGEHLHIAPRNRFYADVLVRLVAQNLAGIDDQVTRNLSNWRLERLSVVDRNLLRLGTAEMLFVDDVPPRVTIREMIRLAEKYGTRESPRFVNGVLDAVMREVAPAEADPR